jgi:hypothetical protein
LDRINKINRIGGKDFDTPAEGSRNMKDMRKAGEAGPNYQIKPNS